MTGETAKKRGRPKKIATDKEVLFPEITIDFETTVADVDTSRDMFNKTLEYSAFTPFAYSVQFGLMYQKTDEKGKISVRYEAHIFLDNRIERVAKPKEGIILHLVGIENNYDCVKAGVEWLEETFYHLRATKSHNSPYGANIIAHAFNAGFEESYMLASMFDIGYESKKVIPKGYGGVMVSVFERSKEYVNKDGEIKSQVYKFTLKETAGQWRPNTCLAEVFDIYGLGEKTKTPLFCFEMGRFVIHDTGEKALIDEHFLDYSAKDVIGLFQALMLKRAENGQPKTMTASSTTLLKHKEWFIEEHSEEEYEKYFKGALLETDKWLRDYTLGGYNYVNSMYKNVYQYPDRQFVRFLGIDRTNAYLSCMVFGTFPWGDGVYFKGEYVPEKTMPFYFQKIRIISAFQRKGYMPSLQWKHGTAEDVVAIFPPDIMSEDGRTPKTSEEDRIFIVNSEELELMRETYTELQFEFIDGYMYKQVSGDFLYGDYLKDKFYKRKEIKEKIAELKKEPGVSQERDREIQQLKAQADTLKLWGNGLYGKFFENPNKSIYQWFEYGNGEIDYEETKTVMQHISPSHIGSQILRTQRLALITACNKIIKAGGEIFQCDTDAFLCGINKEMYDKYPDLDAEKLCSIAGIVYGEDLGQWHIEKDAKEGITVEKKVYAWSHDVLTREERMEHYAFLEESGHEFHFGTRGVNQEDAKAQLTPLTWRRGAKVQTTRFARLGKMRRGQIQLEKVLAI